MSVGRGFYSFGGVRRHNSSRAITIKFDLQLITLFSIVEFMPEIILRLVCMVFLNQSSTRVV